ncbi:hypothetical protein BsWGS_11410 [Bradybaena similaris]
MSSSERKTNTAAFTSALKQVFYIHKNIVAELYAQLDMVTEECKLLKSNSHISKSSGKCESCTHLEKMNRSLQEHFNSLLREKDIGIKTLEKKLQSLTDKANTVSSQTQKDKMLPKEMSNTAAKQELLLTREQAFSHTKSDTSQHLSSSNNVCFPPLNTCSQGEIANLSESEFAKGHSKLRLTRPGKRHSRYVEEQRETKRVKISPSAVAKSDGTSDRNLRYKENSVPRPNETLFVADTVCNTQQINFKSNLKDVGNDRNNEQLLVVPETLAIDTSSNSGCEHETELEKQHDDHDNTKELIVCTKENYHLEDADSFLNISGRLDKGNLQTEITILLDDDGDMLSMENSNEDNTVVVCGRNKTGGQTQLLKEPIRKSFFQGENNAQCVLQQPSYDGKVCGGDAKATKRPLQNHINVKDVKESKSIVNDVTLINKESSHHVDIDTENAPESNSTIKQNCHMLRKNSSACVRNAANQKEPDSSISNSKLNSLSRDHNVGIMKENLTASKSMQQTPLNQAFTVKGRLIETSKTGGNQRKVKLPVDEESEKLQLAEAIRRSLTDLHNTQNNLKTSEDRSLESNVQVSLSSPELDSVKIKNTWKCNSKNLGKEMTRNKVENLSAVEKLLSLQIPSEVKNLGEATETTKSTEHRLLNSVSTNIKDGKTSKFNALEPNGSLNPEIHLTEYLVSEMTEKQKVNQTFCALDETIAPNLMSQYMAGPEQNAGTSQITKLNTEINRHIQIQQNDNKLHVKTDEWWDDDDESLLNNTVFGSDEDDAETIKPSPQLTFQSRSQLHSSIPASSSSYKFTHKKPQVTSQSALGEIGEPENISSEDSIMDESGHLLHDKPDSNLDQSPVPRVTHSPPSQTLSDSFDRVPKSEGIEFPHVSVVRKKSERSKLEGFSCKQCYEYYKNSGLSEEALQQKKNECSRHRERYRAPDTPEHFWSLGFPDTAEMIERRQQRDSQESRVPAQRVPRRRQPLEKKF